MIISGGTSLKVYQPDHSLAGTFWTNTRSCEKKKSLRFEGLINTLKAGLLMKYFVSQFSQNFYCIATIVLTL